MPFTETSSPDGRRTYQIENTSHRFEQPATTLTTSDPRRAAFEKSLKAVGDFEELSRAVAADKDLSSAGRANKLNPERVKVVAALASNFADLSDIDASAAAAERAMLAPPTLDPANTSAAVRGATILQWWAGLDVQGRARVQQQMLDDPEAYEETMLAILHAPPAMRDTQSDEVLSYWEALQRKRNPAKAASIQEARDAVEWSRRGVAHLTGVANRLLGWNADQVLGALAASEKPRGFELFGFAQTEIDGMKQRMQRSLETA